MWLFSIFLDVCFDTSPQKSSENETRGRELFFGGLDMFKLLLVAKIQQSEDIEIFYRCETFRYRLSTYGVVQLQILAHLLLMMTL